MNKKALVIVIVIVLLLIGAGAFLLKGKSASNTPQSQQSSASSGTQKKSLFDFFSMTGSLKCTFANTTDNSSGTVYAAVGKMRGDFESINNGNTVQSHMVNDGTYVYIWTNGQKTGYKMSLASMKSEAGKAMSNTNGGSSQSMQGMDMKKQSDYTCSPWV